METIKCTYCKTINDITDLQDYDTFKCCNCGNHSNVKKDDKNKVKNKASTHYGLWDGVEAIDIIKQTLSHEEYRGFLKGNILKYQLRLGKKDDTQKEVIKITDYANELKGL